MDAGFYIFLMAVLAMLVVRIYITRSNRPTYRPKYDDDPNPDTAAAEAEPDEPKHRRRAAYGAARARTKIE